MHTQETIKDGKAGLQSKFQHFNAKVNQNVTSDGQTEGHHHSM